MKKLVIILTILCIMCSSKITNAESHYITESNGKYKLLGGFDTDRTISMLQGSDIIGELPRITFFYQDGNRADGIFEYPNYDNMRLGTWDLEWKFTPDDTSYGVATGKFTLNVREPDDIKADAVEKTEAVKNNSENITLSAKKLTLDNGVEYDINLKNKIKGSIYKWTTTDKKVAKINKYGVVTGVKKGKAVITCTVTTPDNEVIKLKCNVTVK